MSLLNFTTNYLFLRTLNILEEGKLKIGIGSEIIDWFKLDTKEKKAINS